MSTLFTLAEPAEYEEDIRKSRFLARAAAVDDAAAALAFVARVADPGAHHNCWAYRLGGNYRYHDDGEPGGTAGRPILQAIEGQSCDGVVVVVTRWFGGVKLGTGGLARAYGGCAAQCLRQAKKVPLVELCHAQLVCTYAELPLFKARLAELGVRFEAERFIAEGVELSLAVPRATAEQAAHMLTDLSRGRLNVAWDRRPSP